MIWVVYRAIDNRNGLDFTLDLRMVGVTWQNKATAQTVVLTLLEREWVIRVPRMITLLKPSNQTFAG
jgi:hypothetical protein